MDYINKIGEEIGKAAKFISKETGKLVESAKLTYTASDIESQLEKAYASVGKKFIDSCLHENNIPEQLTQEFELILELKKALGDAKDKIAEIKNTKKCPACSEPIAESDAYCKKCGAKSE
ncbi:MAG: hypothetical protein IJE46_05175 [Clostridia bacterium]|nr:hypothetical protein [Clostridia bacterium]